MSADDVNKRATIQLLTTKEAATILRISRNKVADFLPRVRLSAHGIRYDMRDVISLIERSKERHPKRELP